MGEAKNRGTPAQRKALAIARTNIRAKQSVEILKAQTPPKGRLKSGAVAVSLLTGIGVASMPVESRKKSF